MSRKRWNIVVFMSVLCFLLNLSRFANAANGRLVLNYEAIRFRAIIERQVENICTLRDTLQFCESLFPIQTQAEIQKNVGADSWGIYKKMLDMRDSGEVFNWYLEFLSENDRLRGILRNTFVPVKPGSKEPNFKIGSNDFSIRWLWLYPTTDGLQIVAQEDMTQAAANQIWGTGGVYYIFELRFPLSDGLRQSPFWEKGVAKLKKTFPGASIKEDPFELVYEVFPHVSSVPAIIQRAFEMME